MLRHRPLSAATVLALLLVGPGLAAQVGIRREPRIPAPPDVVVLRCDFHMHTVFSDGKVWPAIRATEAWQEGLDAFAVTDHLEYQPHEDDVKVGHDRSFELSRGRSRELDLIQVRGAEITRKMPPGHFNAIFTRDNSALAVDAWRDSIRAAATQGAFIFWNHPPFPQPEGKAVWYPEHQEILENGWMHGIEVVNGRSYYPEAHLWCLEKKLTMIGSSDVHDPMGLAWDLGRGEHRPMTLVLAKERTERALLEALRARRTVVWIDDRWIGEAPHLEALLRASIRRLGPELAVRGKGRALLQIQNASCLPFRLKLDGEVEGLSVPSEVTVHREATTLLELRGTSETRAGSKEVELPYRVTNLLVRPDEGLSWKLKVPVRFVATRKPEERVVAR